MHTTKEEHNYEFTNIVIEIYDHMIMKITTHLLDPQSLKEIYNTMQTTWTCHQRKNPFQTIALQSRIAPHHLPLHALLHYMNL
jgi:hypothetical protein